MNIYTTEYWSVYDAGTTLGVTASREGMDHKQHFVTGVFGYIDQATSVIIRSGTDVLANWTFTDADTFSFTGLNLPVDPADDASVEIDDSTSGCAVTLQGYSLPVSSTT